MLGSSLCRALSVSISRNLSLKAQGACSGQAPKESLTLPLHTERGQAGAASSAPQGSLEPARGFLQGQGKGEKGGGGGGVGEAWFLVLQFLLWWDNERSTALQVPGPRCESESQF